MMALRGGEREREESLIFELLLGFIYSWIKYGGIIKGVAKDLTML